LASYPWFSRRELSNWNSAQSWYSLLCTLTFTLYKQQRTECTILKYNSKIRLVLVHHLFNPFTSLTTSLERFRKDLQGMDMIIKWISTVLFRAATQRQIAQRNCHKTLMILNVNVPKRIIIKRSSYTKKFVIKHQTSQKVNITKRQMFQNITKRKSSQNN
jgi:hypothetical protein